MVRPCSLTLLHDGCLEEKGSFSPSVYEGSLLLKNV